MNVLSVFLLGAREVTAMKTAVTLSLNGRRVQIQVGLRLGEGKRGNYERWSRRGMEDVGRIGRRAAGGKNTSMFGLKDADAALVGGREVYHVTKRKRISASFRLYCELTDL